VEAELRDMLRASFRALLEKNEAARLREDLVASGWGELEGGDRDGAIEILFEEQGRRIAATPALDLVAARELGRPDAADEALLYPDPGARDRAPAALLAGNPNRVEVSGLLLAGAQRASALLVVAAGDGGKLRAARVVSDAPGLTREDVSAFDPEQGWTRVRAELSREHFERSVLGDADWSRAIAACRRALGWELVGVSEALLAIAIQHVSDRHQFGRAIGSFQTVKHRLADVRIAISAARVALGAAAEDAGALSSAAAKALAGRAGLLAAKHASQVCGALGFTWEQGLHRYVRRVYTIDAFLGTQAWLAAELGKELLSARRVPRIGAMRGS
jgi:hypothetical protein